MASRHGRAIPEPLALCRRVRRQAAWLNGHFEGLLVYGMLASQWLRRR